MKVFLRSKNKIYNKNVMLHKKNEQIGFLLFLRKISGKLSKTVYFIQVIAIRTILSGHWGQ